MTTFGNRLRASRKKMKMSQATVAKRVGMPQSLLSELERDEYTTSAYTTRLAHLYKVNARWLSDGLGPISVSEAEALDDPQVLDLWTRYSAADEASRAMVQYLLRARTDKKPEWISNGLASLIEHARALMQEQIKEASK